MDAKTTPSHSDITVSQLEMLVDIARYLTESLEVSEVLHRIANGAVKLVNTKGCAIYLLEDDGETLTPTVVVEPDNHANIMATPISVSRSLTGLVVENKRGMIFNNAAQYERYQVIPGTDFGDECLVSVPLIVDDTVMGAMSLGRDGIPFTQIDLFLAETFARYAAIALKNAQVHHALQTTKERYHQLFENMSSGVAVYEVVDDGRDFIIADFNRAGEKIGAVNRADVIGRLVTEAFPEAKQYGLLEVFQRVWRTGEPESFSLVYYGDDLLLRWRENHVYKLPTGELVAIYDDVSAEKAAEQALQESEERFRSLFETINNGVAFFAAVDDGRDFVFKDFNRAGERIEQVNREDIIGERVTHAFPGVVRSGLIEVFRRVYRTGKPEKYSLSFHQEGGIGWRENYVYKLPSGEIVAVYDDVTAQKQAEEALKASEERFRMLFDNLPAVCWTYDRDGRILEWNKTAENIYGWSAEEAVGKTMFELMVQPENVERTQKNIAAVFRGEELSDLEFEDICADGSKRILLANEYPLKNAAGEVLKGICAEIDITARKEAEAALQKSEAQLQHAQKMESIGTLAGGVAHDFNNLLTAINGQAELGLMKLPEEHPVRKNLDGVLQAGKRAAKLTGQLLAFSRRQIYRPKQIDLNRHIRHTAEMLRSLIPEDIVLDFSLRPTLPPINADPTQLEQVLVNLVVNARDAIQEYDDAVIKKITVNTCITHADDTFVRLHPGSSVGKFVCLCVYDTGIGMDEMTKARIFEPFFTTKPKGHGTGLGLAMVYGIVKQNNGNIYVESEKGQGTRIRVLWPYATTPEVSPEEELMDASAAAHTGTETILLVEDDPAVRIFTADALRTLGYTLLVAENGKHALALLEQNPQPFDILLTDVVMPEMDGPQLARTLREKQPQLPVLFISGYTRDLIGRDGNIARAIEFLPKPFSTHDLAQKVRMILDAPRKIRDE